MSFSDQEPENGSYINQGKVRLLRNSPAKILSSTREDFSLNAFIFENPVIGIFSADPASGKIIECNEKFLELFSANSPDEIDLTNLLLSSNQKAVKYGKQFIKVSKTAINTNNPLCSFDLITDIMEEEQDEYSAVWDILIPGERAYPCEFFAKVERDENGSVKRILGIAEDIALFVKENPVDEGSLISSDTPEHSSESFVKREKFYSKLFNSVNDAIIVTELPVLGKKGMILEVNDYACKMLEYSRTELLQMNAADIMFNGYVQRRAQYMWRFMRDGHIEYETTIITKSKSELPVEVNAKLFMLEGQPVVVSIGRDVRERKASEREMKSYSRQLYELNAQKDKLFSIIAHDLRGPFNALLGFTNILANDIDNMSKDEIRAFASDTHKAGLRVFGLIENLLNWSRLQTGSLRFNPRKINVCDLCEKIMELYNPSFKQKNIKVTINKSRNLLINADYNMLNSALQNLISNAIKFTPEGGVIEIGARGMQEEVEIYVKDNGVGIKKENINKMFRMDERLSTEGTNREQGSGLGLLLCKEFVEKNGGRITVTSELGKGSVFTIILPRV